MALSKPKKNTLCFARFKIWESGKNIASVTIIVLRYRDYSTAMQSGYGSLGAQGMPPQYGPSGVSGPQAQYAGQQAMATPHNMQPPSIQQTPQMFMSHQQQDPMQTSHSGMQAPIQ